MSAQIPAPPTPAMELATVESIRARFPALARRHLGQPVCYFDGPGGTQVPCSVVEAMTDYLYQHNANTHWNYPSSIETDAAIAHARGAMADFFNASPGEVAFGNNMTTITFHVSRALGRAWGAGDEIVVTDLDHQANVSPWQALAKERGITIRSVPFDAAVGEWSLSELQRAVSRKTRLVAVGAASNALGTISPVREAAQIAHASGALCFVDAVHYAAHHPIDVLELDCDFLVCSPYKFYGPHIGVLYARAGLIEKLDVPKVAPAPNHGPDRLETGTQNHEGIVGAGAAVEFLASLAPGSNRRECLMHALSGLHERGEALFERLWYGLSSVEGVRCFGPPPDRPRTPTLSFVVAGSSSRDVAASLAREGIFVSNGNFYASEVVKCLGYNEDGLVRAGCACYTTELEVDRLIEGVKKIPRVKTK